MKEVDLKDVIYFGESVPFIENEPSSKKDAEDYLRRWKYYLLFKLKDDLYDYEPYDGQIIDGDKMKLDPDGWYEHWVYRPASAYSPFGIFSSVGLKFAMTKKLPGTLG